VNDRSRNHLNWSDVLFVENPWLYLPFLVDQRKNSGKETDGIVKLLRQNDISEGSKILDFSCGIGRHSIELAKRGYRVVGYDPSQLFLEVARKYSVEELTQSSNLPKFFLGNPYDPSRVLLGNDESDFDAMIIMDNSIGYTGSSNDRTMLRELNKIAGRNCILIIETENRDWRLRNFESMTLHEFDHISVFEKWNFNLESSEFESLSSFYEKVNGDKNDLKMLLQLGTTMRLYSLHELITLLNESGWKYLNSYDSIMQLDPVRIDSGPNIATVSIAE
jgi:SAM-dependent methyltransferase